MHTARKVWTSPVPPTCEICSSKITTAFYDSRYRGLGWAILCPDCFRSGGAGTGTGLGQKYELEATSGEFVKVAG